MAPPTFRALVPRHASPGPRPRAPQPGPRRVGVGSDGSPSTARKVSLAGFPNASNTGAHGKLRVISGDRTVTKDGTVLEHVEIHGSLTIDADDVLVRNVKVVSDGFWPVRANGRGVRLIRSTFVGTAESQASLAGHYVGRRLNLYGAGDGARMSGGVL